MSRFSSSRPDTPMHPEFWHAKWRRSEIGFHEDAVNPLLEAHWPDVAHSSEPVFVPLCGKSIDLLWLAKRGHRVVGSEISPVAVEQFFSESALDYDLADHGELSLYQSGEIAIWCGDFFQLTAENLGVVKFIYDRGATVALPYEMRHTYAERLVSFMPPAARALLITLDYDQREMNGPPFAIDRAEVEALYGAKCDIELLATDPDALEHNAKLKTRGARKLSECAYRLIRRPS